MDKIKEYINNWKKEYEIIEYNTRMMAVGMDEDNNIEAFGDLQTALRQMKAFGRQNGAKGKFKFRIINIRTEDEYWKMGDIQMISKDKKILTIKNIVLENNIYGEDKE